MKITSIKARRDGKYLVGLHFSHGANLRKVMGAEELVRMREKVEAERKQTEEWHKTKDGI